MYRIFINIACLCRQCHEGATLNMMAHTIEQRVFLSENLPRLESFLERPLGECATPGGNVIKQK
jgi:hypothetical protein